MATFDIQKATEAIENPDLKDTLSHLITQLSTKYERILAYENRITELEERVDECEKYSSKECSKI